MEATTRRRSLRTTNTSSTDQHDDDVEVIVGNEQTELQILKGMDSKLFIVRGPLVIATVLLPPILSHFADPTKTNLLKLESVMPILTMMIRLVFAIYGLTVFVKDLYHLALKRTRAAINQTVDHVIVDESLRTLVDALSKCTSCTLGTSIGGLVLYASSPSLISDQDRLRLVQSTLELQTPEQAERLLRQPGAIKTLLPDSIKRWLNEEYSQNDDLSLRNQCTEEQSLLSLHLETTVKDSPASVLQRPVIKNQQREHTDKPKILPNDSDCNSSTSSADRDANNPTPTHRNGVRRPLATPSTTVQAGESQTRPQGPAPESPHLVLWSILRKSLVKASLKAYQHQLKFLPQRILLERTCKATAMGLALQLGLSRKARQIVWAALQATTTFTMLTLFSGSLSLLLLQEGSTQTGNRFGSKEIRNAIQGFEVSISGALKTLQSLPIPEDLSAFVNRKLLWMKQVLNKILRGGPETKRKLQGIAAALVLLYFTHQRSRKTLTNESTLRVK